MTSDAADSLLLRSFEHGVQLLDGSPTPTRWYRGDAATTGQVYFARDRGRMPDGQAGPRVSRERAISLWAGRDRALADLRRSCVAGVEEDPIRTGGALTPEKHRSSRPRCSRQSEDA